MSGEATPHSPLSLREFSLKMENSEHFNVWTNLPIIKCGNILDRLSRREVLVSELQFSIVRKEFVYQKELTELLRVLRRSVFWGVGFPPKYVRRQAIFIATRLKIMADIMLENLERNSNNEESIVLNLHRLFDLLHRSMSQEFSSALIAYSDILSELRQMINKHRSENRDSKEVLGMWCPIEKVLVPYQRLAELKSTLLKICDDLRDQKRLATAHRALDSVAGALDQCYEYLTLLHGSSYVADIDNILDLRWKPSSLKYRRHRADYLVLPRCQAIHLSAKPPLPAKNGTQLEEEHVSVDALYELVDVPLSYAHTSPSAEFLQKSFHRTPLYQALPPVQSQDLGSRSIKEDKDAHEKEIEGQYLRTLWCQIEPVISSGILDKLTSVERALMEAKFEIISTEVSYLKSLCILITIFYESLELRKLVPSDDIEALFSNIPQVKEASEKFLDDVAYSLSRDVLMSDLCSLVRVHANTTFRVYVAFCSDQPRIHTTFQRLVCENENLVEALGHLESSSSCQGYSLVSFLTLPMQRVTRLPLLMSAVLGRLPGRSSLQHHEATAALQTLTQLVNECNEAVAKSDKKLRQDFKKRKSKMLK